MLRTSLVWHKQHRFTKAICVSLAVKIRMMLAQVACPQLCDSRPRSQTFRAAADNFRCETIVVTAKNMRTSGTAEVKGGYDSRHYL